MFLLTLSLAGHAQNSLVSNSKQARFFWLSIGPSFVNFKNSHLETSNRLQIFKSCKAFTRSYRLKTAHGVRTKDHCDMASVLREAYQKWTKRTPDHSNANFKKTPWKMAKYTVCLMFSILPISNLVRDQIKIK